MPNLYVFKTKCATDLKNSGAKCWISQFYGLAKTWVPIMEMRQLLILKRSAEKRKAHVMQPDCASKELGAKSDMHKKRIALHISYPSCQWHTFSLFEVWEQIV